MDTSSLPKKEAGLLKDAMKLLDGKQYKKALKIVEGIVKKFPQHGESVSIRALLLYHVGFKEEAHRCAREGISLALGSHVVWHVMGLIHKMDKNNAEAASCYKAASERASDPHNILRDLTEMQVMQRDFSSLVATRLKLLKARPELKIYWLGLATAHHLNGNPAAALQVLDAHWKSLPVDRQGCRGRLESEKGGVREIDVEASELQLYKAQLLEQCGELEKALEHYYWMLSEDSIPMELRNQANCHPVCRDPVAAKENMCRLHLLLGQRDRALPLVWELFEFNPSNYEYFDYLCESELGYKTPAEPNDPAFVKVMQGVQEKFPRVNTATRLLLNHLQGDMFVETLHRYAVPFLRKGIPSLHRSISSLYKDPGLVECIQRTFSHYMTCLEAKKPLSSPLGEASEEGAAEDPSVEFWVLSFLSEHFIHLNQLETALELVDRALEHTPTVPEIYVIKAKIQKRLGLPEDAADTANAARLLDISDRNLNKIAVKHMFACGQMERAVTTAAEFLKDNIPGELQWSWFEWNRGKCLLRQGNFIDAMGKFKCIDKFFEDYYDDQRDFHYYCLRKSTLNAYIDMVRMMDQVWHNVYFRKAAVELANGHMSIYLDPSRGMTEEERLMASLPENERRKLERKKQQAAEKAAASSGVGQSGAGGTAKKGGKKGGKRGGKKGGPKKSDSKPADVKGDSAAAGSSSAAAGSSSSTSAAEELVSSKEPKGSEVCKLDGLVEATRLVQLLVRHNGDHIDSYLTAARLYRIKGLWLAMVRSLRHALRLDSSNPRVIVAVIQGLAAVEECGGRTDRESSDLVEETLRSPSGIPALLRALDLAPEATSRDVLQFLVDRGQSEGDWSTQVYAAQAQLLLESQSSAENAGLWAALVAPFGSNTSHKTVLNMLPLVREHCSPEQQQEFLVLAASRFPQTTCFRTPSPPQGPSDST